MIENPVVTFQPIDIENNGESVLFEYKHVEGLVPVNLTITVKVVRDLNFPTIEPQCKFVIRSNDRECALVCGRIRRGKKDKAIEFREGSTINFTKIRPEEERMPRIVGASIAELVCGGYITRWYSSNSLTFDGRKLYGSYLSSDDRLHVVGRSSSTDNRYLVTARPQAK